VLGILALCLLVAALIRRPPPDFAAQPILAVLPDGAGHPLWRIRLAPAADEITVEAVRPPTVIPGHACQLWLAAAGVVGLQQIGLLPQAGRAIIPVTPEVSQWLRRRAGRLVVTLEPAAGSPLPGPSGPILYRAALGDAG
jgi:anti-sigma-K factor RskA